MSLYTKTLIIIFGVVLTLVVFLYLLSQVILLNSYNHLEQQSVERDVQRVLNALTRQLDHLTIQNGDYANWDDTYIFVQDGNERYIENNLYNETLTSLQVNLMAFINTDGRLIYAKMVDLQTGKEYPVPEDLKTFFALDSPLLNLPPDKQGTQGIVMTDDGPMLITSQHIRDNLGHAPSVGMLIMGALMDDAYLQQFSEDVQLSLSLKFVDDTELPDDFRAAYSSLTVEPSTFIQPLNADRIAGYALINDLNNTPALVLRVDVERSIYEQGQASLSFFLAVLVIIVLAFTITILILLDRLVLRRLSRLSHTLSIIRESGDRLHRVPVEGADELAGLAADINATLTALAGAQDELQQANLELEERVRARTQELSTTNSHLAEEIGQHQRTQAQLAQARDQAVEALNLKAQILANVSHDSRTPLSVISLRTELLRDGRYGTVNDKQVETLESILVNTRQLLGFINNLLSESQAQAHTMKIKSIPFQPADWLEEVTSSVATLVESHELTFKIEHDAELPETIQGDPERLTQILTNLIDNAIKFTPKGGVEVRIFKQEARWGIQVADTGIGIAAEAQTHIFDAFWQVDGSNTRQVNQGVGLGLSIVKQLTTLMGGEIQVQSQPGLGSTFTVLLPLSQPTKELIRD